MQVGSLKFPASLRDTNRLSNSKIEANLRNCLSSHEVEKVSLSKPFVFDNFISVKAAAFHSGYNMQYLRRLLRDGKLSGVKLGQAWLIDKGMFEAYLENAHHTKDKRFGPKLLLT